MRISILDRVNDNFTNGGASNCSTARRQGASDAFFGGGGRSMARPLSPVGTGPIRRPRCAASGCFLARPHVLPRAARVILFREEHSPRVFKAEGGLRLRAGTSEGIVKSGGLKHALADRHGAVHLRQGEKKLCVACIKAIRRPMCARRPASTTTTGRRAGDEAPSAENLALLRGRVTEELSESYPAFADMRGESGGGPA